MTLEDAYALRVSQTEADAAPVSQLLPVKDAVWGSGKLNINRDQVIFHGRLLDSSKAAESLRARGEDKGGE